MPTDTFAPVVTGGKSSGCEKAVGVAVAVGVDVGVAVAVAVAVAAAVAVAVTVAVAVAVAVGVAVTVVVAVGVGVGVAVVYSTVSTGGLALSRVSKRFVVLLVDSSPRTEPTKVAGWSFSHDCTSATIWAELHV